jgi:hypothetical protein
MNYLAPVDLKACKATELETFGREDGVACSSDAIQPPE